MTWRAQDTARRIIRIEDLSGVREELNRSAFSIVMDSLAQRIGVAPVEGGRTVHDQTYGEGAGSRVERQATSSAENTANLPSADDGVQPARRIPADPAPATERKLINSIRGDEMPDVEVGIPTAHAEVARVANQTAKHRIRDARLIIYRVREGVVEVELKAA